MSCAVSLFGHNQDFTTHQLHIQTQDVHTHIHMRAHTHTHTTHTSSSLLLALLGRRAGRSLGPVLGHGVWNG